MRSKEETQDMGPIDAIMALFQDYGPYIFLSFALFFYFMSSLFGAGSGTKARARHILVKDKKTADELVAKLKTILEGPGGPGKVRNEFALMARAHSTCPS